MKNQGPPVTAIVLALPDGRSLAFTELGDPDGTPVIAFHGTPGSRLQLSGGHEAALGAGVRLVLPDRPGYGHSSWQPGRRLAHWPADMAALADHLCFEHFAVVGVSGGGPHALACAALLGERVQGVGVVSGAGPMADPALLRRAPVAQRALMRLRLLWLPVACALVWLGLLLFRLAPGAVLTAACRWMPERDAQIVRRPEIRRRLLDEARMVPSRTTARAATQDFALFSRPWGLPLDHVDQNVDLWQGDADTTVPIDHARHLTQVLPRATLHVLPGEGHLLVEERLGEVLRTVTAQTGRHARDPSST